MKFDETLLNNNNNNNQQTKYNTEKKYIIQLYSFVEVNTSFYGP